MQFSFEILPFELTVYVDTTAKIGIKISQDGEVPAIYNTCVGVKYDRDHNKVVEQALALLQCSERKIVRMQWEDPAIQSVVIARPQKIHRIK